MHVSTSVNTSIILIFFLLLLVPVAKLCYDKIRLCFMFYFVLLQLKMF